MLRQRERRPTSEDGEDAAPVAELVRVQGSSQCPLCLEPLTALPRLDVCPECQTIHHHTCVAEMGRCGTMGCEGLASQTTTESEQLNAAVAHAAALVGGGFVAPLILWAIMRNKNRFVAHHALQATVFSLLSILLALTVVWIPLMFFFMIRATVRAYRGELSPGYPLMDRILPPPADLCRERAAKRAAVKVKTGAGGLAGS